MKSPSSEGEQEREGHDRAVDPDLLEPGDALGLQREQQAHARGGEGEAQQAADQREADALDEEHAGDLAAGGADRGAHRHLPLAALGPHEVEVRHVGPGDEQDDADAAQEQPEGAREVAHHARPGTA